MTKRTRLLRTALLAAACALALPAQAASTEELQSCLAGLQSDAAAAGVGAAAYRGYTADLAPDDTVLAALDAQPEFVTPIWDYLAALVDDERVADGQALMQKWGPTLSAVEAAYGVPANIVVAVWGVESNYGRNFGKRPLLRSLATLSCFGRRQGYFRSEFINALQIADAGNFPLERFTGSWAGAFGQTQFMPSTFLANAVDFDGDGRRDLIDSVPDALASTANFLARAGWQSGQPWGWEVRLPEGFDASVAARRNKKPLAYWSAKGVQRVDGGKLPGGDTPAALLLPADQPGPAFLVLKNFDAIYRYNAAQSYTLAIVLLADRLAGGPGLQTRWPTDDIGLSRAQRRELQALLLVRGYDIGEPDGVIGSRTRAAIEAEQGRLGMTPDGRAGTKLLEALRADPIPAGR